MAVSSWVGKGWGKARGRGAASYNSKAAGVGDGGGELGVADPLHTALDYGDWGGMVSKVLRYSGRGFVYF